MSKITGERKREKKKKAPNVFMPIFTLFITIGLLYLLFIDFQALQSGDSSSKRIFIIIIESVGIFVVPLIFNPKIVKKRFSNKFKLKEVKEIDEFKLRIYKIAKLDAKYSQPLIKKCPKCKFENPRMAKRCFNCNYDLRI